MPVFAMGLILLSHLPGIWTFKRIFILFLCLLFLQLGFESNIISTLSENDLDAMYARLSYADDRAEVFNAALLNLYDNPFFGIGSEKLDFYEHAHNSYLQVAQKFGGYGLIVFLSLVYVAIFRNLSLAGNWLFVALFLIVTSMQIGLLYPNFLILIKVYLSAFSTDKVLVQKMNEKSNVF
jgi:O-antigen ligase